MQWLPSKQCTKRNFGRGFVTFKGKRRHLLNEIGIVEGKGIRANRSQYEVVWTWRRKGEAPAADSRSHPSCWEAERRTTLMDFRGWMGQRWWTRCQSETLICQKKTNPNSPPVASLQNEQKQALSFGLMFIIIIIIIIMLSIIWI